MTQKSAAMMVFAGMLAVVQMTPAATACVDFGCTDGDMVPLGSKHLVLRVTGTVDANAKFKAVNCGQPCSLTASVEDGLVYVHVKSGGTVLLIR